MQMRLLYDVAMAVGAALNTSPRPPELYGLVTPGYPVRELSPVAVENHVRLIIPKWGRGYKQKRKAKVESFSPERLYKIACCLNAQLPKNMEIIFIIGGENNIIIIVEVSEK